MIFSIIVPVYNAEKTLPALFAALKAQAFAVSDFEVVFVDDGSTDGSVALCQQFAASAPFQVTCLSVPHGGPGLARNVGVAVAQGEFVAFTDADCEPKTNWLTTQHARLMAQPHSVVCGTVTCADTLLFPWKMAPAGHQYVTASMAGSRDLFLTYPFRSEVRGLCGSDVDLVMRLRAAGVAIITAPEVLVVHPVKKYSWRQLVTRAWSRQHEVLLWRDYGKHIAWTINPLFQPRALGHVSPAAVGPLLILLLLVLLLLHYGWLGLLTVLLLGLVGLIVFVMYGFRLLVLHGDYGRVTFLEKLYTLLALLVYYPVFVVARLYGSLRFRYMMI
jgi:glycosyltransferase involved in cell wall biosynthesis